MKARGNRLQFEDALPPEVAPLDLRHDGVLSGAWMSEEAPAFGLAGVNLGTWTGFGSTTYWNAVVANLEMHGSGTF
jgi:hypothetical protein